MDIEKTITKRRVTRKPKVSKETDTKLPVVEIIEVVQPVDDVVIEEVKKIVTK